MSYLRLKFALPVLMASTFATQVMADDYFDNASAFCHAAG